jgi:hypothetical protein
MALNDNINKFEDQNGNIAINEQVPPFPMGFGGPTGQA